MAVKLNIAAKPLKKLLPFVKKNQKLMTRIISVKLKRDMPKTEPFKDNAIYIIIESRFQKIYKYNLFLYNVYDKVLTINLGQII